ncbi:hypothetical protein IWW52_006783, partial [Coemansia sp. RSA 2704]
MKGPTKPQQIPRSTKRRKAGKSATPTTDESWADITLNPPPMPPPRTTPSLAKPATNKKPRQKKPVPVDSGDMDVDSESDLELSWKRVAVPTHIASADNEIGGVLSLQEIDGVDCVWDKDEATGGKLLRFTKSKTTQKRKKRNRGAQLASVDDMESLDDVNWDDFVPVDDFSEAK